MKRANGSGSILQHKGARRRPYEARVTTGRDERGRQAYRSLGWFATRDDAMAALLEYNQSPYDIDSKKITLSELFSRWYARTRTQGRLAPRTIDNLRYAYKHCDALADVPYIAIRAHAMQSCIDSCSAKISMQQIIKSLFAQLDDYAMELDITAKRYSALTHTAAYAPAKKTIFSDFEVARLWENINAPWVDTALMLLYGGWRISELLSLTKENIFIDATRKKISTMRGGKKTTAGKDRIVPIHSAILPLVVARYDSAENYLIEGRRGFSVADATYRSHWADVMALIGARHTPHEARHTFRSWLDSASAPISCVNKIMGHTCSDVGLQVYTHKTIEQLSETIELIRASEQNYTTVGKCVGM